MMLLRCPNCFEPWHGERGDHCPRCHAAGIDAIHCPKPSPRAAPSSAQRVRHLAGDEPRSPRSPRAIGRRHFICMSWAQWDNLVRAMEERHVLA